MTIADDEPWNVVNYRKGKIVISLLTLHNTKEIVTLQSQKNDFLCLK